MSVKGKHVARSRSDRHTASPATADDHLVMATNNSSIVSKRSVERLYYPNEPHFFRFFVNKPQRRAPLINRGYHFRLHVIDVTLRDFLKKPSPKTKVVVNLGCGSDVVPWQCWTRYSQHCHDSRAVFVDVDFPDLIRQKRQVVLSTPQLASHLTSPQIRDGDEQHGLFLRSDRYYQIGCDLRHTAVLEKALASIVDLQHCVIIFVAEVSITYMETETADALIQWASRIGHADFCLLEQILPHGPSHPFAQTMLAHFHKLSTPIKSVTTYATEQQQRTRFASRGWPSVRTQSLWSAWHDESYLTAQDRRMLNQIEPFDEWEEFALFASHYLLLRACNYDSASSLTVNPVAQSFSTGVRSVFEPFTGQRGLRRFGAAMAVTDSFGREVIINCLGLGNTTRLPSYDTYVRGEVPRSLIVQPLGGPSSRMCFTSTDLGEKGFLLTGGRSSPSKAMNDCWLFSKSSHRWERTFDLPVPLYRHSACRLAGSCLALVAGGRSASTGISDMLAVFHPGKGWLRCDVVGSLRPEAVFGAILVCTLGQTGLHPVFRGFLAGGLHEDGSLNRSIWAWKLLFADDDEPPTIAFSHAEVVGEETACLLSRFGAAYVQAHNTLTVLGGIGNGGAISRESDIVLFATTDSRIQMLQRLTLSSSNITSQSPWPLLVGSSVFLTRNGYIAIISGAATCFSMGTFWTKGVYTLDLSGVIFENSSQDGAHELDRWHYLSSGEIIQEGPGFASEQSQSQFMPAGKVTKIEHDTLDATTTFDSIVSDGLPAVLKGLNIGSCVERWDLDYLSKQLGEDRKVVVHESLAKKMDFNAKNFRYTTMAFGDFAREVQAGKSMYLRALSSDAPADQAASLDRDFPMLTTDFSLPQELVTCTENVHSSILRISGPVNMWLHYDVQANVYCQIHGSKRMLLFPPSDVNHLSFAPGASSSSVDVFGSLGSPDLANAHPWEVNLDPGDVLFIPPLWLHAATPRTDISIAVNTFFRSIERSQYSAGRDVYGNRDLAAYEKGRQDVARIANSFAKVPGDVRQFYLSRLAGELAGKASSQPELQTRRINHQWGRSRKTTNPH